MSIWGENKQTKTPGNDITLVFWNGFDELVFLNANHSTLVKFQKEPLLPHIKILKNHVKINDIRPKQYGWVRYGLIIVDTRINFDHDNDKFYIITRTWFEQNGTTQVIW